MAFSEAVYVTLEGGTVLPITDVTGDHTTADIVVYDGETYRNELDSSYLGREWLSGVTSNVFTGGVPGGASFAEQWDDRVTRTAPRYKGKQRSLWSFPRFGKYTHNTWADLVQGTSPLPPYRLGMTPTPLT